ncbi:MAG: ABC transporter substrate-binding protein [Ruminiclostridium sp.]
MSRFFSKAVAFSTAFCMMVLLNGCGQSGNSEKGTSAANESGSKSNSKITLTIRHNDVEPSRKSRVDSFQDAINRFQKDNPNVEVKMDGLDHDTHRAKLKAEMAGGIPPDIFFSYGYEESKPYYEAGEIMDLTELLNSDPEWKDGFMSGSLEAFHYGDGYYGIPLSGFTEGIFYNKDIFKKLGLNPPKTFDDLKEITEKCKNNGIIPIALGNKEKWPSTFVHNYFFERQLGYDYFTSLLNRESGFTWANEDYIKANDKIQELVKLGTFPEGINAISRDEGNALFYQEKAAMCVEGSWAITNFTSDQVAEGFDKKIGFCNFPSFSDGKGDQDTIVASFMSGFCVNGKLTGERKDAACKLLKYLNDDTMAEYQLYNCKEMPNRNLKNMDNQKVSNLFIETIDIMNKASAKLSPHTESMPSGMMQVYYDVSQGIFDLSMTPKQAMDKMEQASNEYLTK